MWVDNTPHSILEYSHIHIVKQCYGGCHDHAILQVVLVLYLATLSVDKFWSKFLQVDAFLGKVRRKLVLAHF
jgi:hypothetical protein